MISKMTKTIFNDISPMGDISSSYDRQQVITYLEQLNSKVDDFNHMGDANEPSHMMRYDNEIKELQEYCL